MAAWHLIGRYFLPTPCPGRNLPEDTCCFDLSGVTGFWCKRMRPIISSRAIITMNEDARIQ